MESMIFGIKRKKIKSPYIPDVLHLYTSEANKPKSQAECAYKATGRCMGCRCCLWSRKTDKCSLIEIKTLDRPIEWA
jgi:hypothetical protein